LILNRQKAVTVDLPAARAFARRLRRLLRLGKRELNVCFVDDREIKRLNAAYRGKRRATDVLSFPWPGTEAGDGKSSVHAEFDHFLGDVVISAPTASRNARRQGHSTGVEICWLILHGALHLLGYDHETDRGEMTTVELSLRGQLGIGGQPQTGRKAPGRRTKRRKRRGGQSRC
jgi:probable rRNA maturation factor